MIEPLLEASQLLEGTFGTLLANSRMGALVLDSHGRVEAINDRLLDVMDRRRDEVVGYEWIRAFIPKSERGGLQRVFRQALASGELRGSREDSVVTASGEVRTLSWASVVRHDSEGHPLGLASVSQDTTEFRRAENERRLLAATVDQSTDPAVITDRDGRIMYVNTAFEHLTGRTAAEAHGEFGLDLLADGPANEAALRAMTEARVRGEPWLGLVQAFRNDGTVAVEAVRLSPIRDNLGKVTHFIAVGRDVTRVTDLETRLQRLVTERAAIGESLAKLSPRGTPEATGAEICRRLTDLPGIEVASIVAFDDDGASMLALDPPAGHPSRVGDRLPVARATHLRQRAALGPWAERWRARPEDGEYGRLLEASGLQASAYGPILGRSGSTVGLLIVATNDIDYAPELVERLPAIAEFGTLAAALLADVLEARDAKDHSRTRMIEVIGGARFRTVFQPIVDLQGGNTIAVEALTRFDEGTRPDVVFAEAVEIGLGIELECATLAVAIRASMALPRDLPLSLNVSPALVLASERLSRLLATVTRPLILEITEHERIDDYPALVTAIRSLTPSVRIAVDDAGAGIANFSHIVELRPDFLKIDAGLVRGIDQDRTRQALAAGLRHFADACGGAAIAEGIETEAEADVLRSLGIRLGQGFLLGRPVSAADLRLTERIPREMTSLSGVPIGP
jgi:PAS domain S-box-containing protein